MQCQPQRPPKPSEYARRDWARLLPAGIPDWLLTCLASFSRAELCDEDLVSTHLTATGVRDPTQQQQMLRELQCFLCTISAPTKPTLPRGSRPRCGRRPQSACHDGLKGFSKASKRSPNRDVEEAPESAFRWPFPPASLRTGPSPDVARRRPLSASPCTGRVGDDGTKRLSVLRIAERDPTAGASRTPITLFNLGSPTRGRERDRTDSSPVSVLSPRLGAKTSRAVRDPIAVLAAESKAEIRWLESRLMPGGPFLIIDTLREAAKQGDVDKLRMTMEKAREHGESFIQSLDTIPTEPDVEIRPASFRKVAFTVAPESAAPLSPVESMGIWTWAEIHLKNLQRAEGEFKSLIKEARSAALAAETFSPPSSDRNPLARRTSVSVNVNGTDIGNMGQSLPQYARSRTEPAMLGSTGENSDSGESGALQEQPEASKSRSAASQRWERCGNMSVGVIVSSTDSSKLDSTRTALRVAEIVGVASFVRAQEQLLASDSSLRKRLALADTMRGMSRTRSELYAEALQAIDGLRESQAQLFHRLLLWLTPVEDELKMQTRGASSRALERTVVKIRTLVGTPTLVGLSGLAAAEALCPLQDGAAAPEDIWAGIALRVPPWESSFNAACRRLTQLRTWERERAARLAQPPPPPPAAQRADGDVTR